MTVQVVQMFQPTVLTTTAATLYSQSMGGPSALLTHGRIRFTNTTAAPVTVTAYGVPDGDTAGATNEFCPGLMVKPNDNLDLDVPVLTTGMFIQALADTADAITAHSLDGVLFT